MHYVFDRVLKTDKGKYFVGKNGDNYDAQRVFSKIVNYCAASSEASLEALKLLSYIK